MIAFLSGKLTHLGEKYAIINVGGVGYRVCINDKTRNILSDNKEGASQPLTKFKTKDVKFYTHLVFNMRENKLDIYGFLGPDDFSLFELLIPVSGIGPKKALNIVSNIESDKLLSAVIKEDSEYLIKVGGLGPKIAARLIVELKGKIKTATKDKFDLGTDSETLDALITLGYGKVQIIEALKKVKSTASTENKIREALKVLSGR